MSVADADIQFVKRFLKELKKVRHINMDILSAREIDDKASVFNVYIRLRDYEKLTKGEYIFYGKMSPSDTLLKPPKIYALTPNGVFRTSTEDNAKSNNGICIGAGTYHADEYPPGIGPDGFFRLLAYNFNRFALEPKAIDSKGIQINIENEGTISKLAEESFAYNKKHFPKIIEMFNNIPLNKIAKYLIPETRKKINEGIKFDSSNITLQFAEKVLRTLGIEY